MHGFSLVAASGATLCCGVRASLVVASLVVEHRLQGLWASVAAAHGLSSCGSQDLEHRLNS